MIQLMIMMASCTAYQRIIHPPVCNLTPLNGNDSEVCYVIVWRDTHKARVVSLCLSRRHAMRVPDRGARQQEPNQVLAFYSINSIVVVTLQLDVAEQSVLLQTRGMHR